MPLSLARLALPVLSLSLLPAAAFELPALKRASRRDFGLAAGAALAAAAPLPALALKPCPPGANNCFSAASTDKNKLAQWSWPAGMSRADAVASLRKSLEAYPQEGQADADKGGWTFAEDGLAEKGYARLEYKSGLGNMAKFFNGGQPFVDDLEVSVEDASVCVRSASRVGDSDFGVNAKRLSYIAADLRKAGWAASAPSP